MATSFSCYGAVSTLRTPIPLSRLSTFRSPSVSTIPNRFYKFRVKCSRAEAGVVDDSRSAPIDVVADVKSERVVVLGGSGFVGSAICKAAVSKGIEVISLSRSGRPTYSGSWVDQVTWKSGDVFYVNWDEVLTGATAVVSTIGGVGSGEFTIFSLCIAFALLFVFFYPLIITVKLKEKIYPNPHLPPGNLGWPVIGETLGFIRAGFEGKPERFIRERMEKYDSRVFKTCLLGEDMIVFCGTAGHKLLFSNENKLVRTWWPSSVGKLFKTCLLMKAGDDAKRMRRMMMMSFLSPNALMKYVERIDMITQQHIATYWEGKEEVKVHPTVKLYTFELACHLLASVEDPLLISKLASHFNIFLKGVMSFPVNFPGTTFYKSIRAADAIREELIKLIAKQTREALGSKQDLLSRLVVIADSNGKFLTEMEVADNILLLLFSSHDTSSSAITLLLKYLGQMPQVFENVLREQIGIAESKEQGELLKWEDIQKMKYTWNVASEVMRLSPPAIGAFREALVDFTYSGYTIPKGWKLHWSTGSTHKDETLFPNPETFDASRFEREGATPYSYVPFGGGPRMCPGYEFERLLILVFIHNMIKRFKWDLLIPDEKFGYDPMLSPSQGLPIRLQPHQCST